VAILLHMEIAETSLAHYDALTEKMDRGGEPPRGVIARTATPMEGNGVRILDVWESQEDLERFEEEQSYPLLETSGGSRAAPCARATSLRFMTSGPVRSGERTEPEDRRPRLPRRSSCHCGRRGRYPGRARVDGGVGGGMVLPVVTRHLHCALASVGYHPRAYLRRPTRRPKKLRGRPNAAARVGLALVLVATAILFVAGSPGFRSANNTSTTPVPRMSAVFSDSALC
jgi:hypothetical protein